LDKFLARTLSCAGQEDSLVAGLVRLARALRLDVVATGAEPGDEFGLARLAGCPYGQGRAVSGALGPEAALRWTALGRVRPRQEPRG
jgi:EAL domain-containing protein (putative c-di-GMP-specific phosphodiesterase class I)